MYTWARTYNIRGKVFHNFVTKETKYSSLLDKIWEQDIWWNEKGRYMQGIVRGTRV